MNMRAGCMEWCWSWMVPWRASSKHDVPDLQEVSISSFTTRRGSEVGLRWRLTFLLTSVLQSSDVVYEGVGGG
jgi:hypothetical protein